VHSYTMDTVKSVIADGHDSQDQIIHMLRRFSWMEDSSDQGLNRPGVEQAISKAFRAAQLLSGSEEQAEIAVLQALDAWDPEDDDPETLFQLALKAAIQNPALPSPMLGSALPVELQAVLKLPTQLRRCFVLRTLVGRSRDACAGLVNLRPQQVDDYNCAALQRLPVLVEQARAEQGLHESAGVKLRIRIPA
jgi:hypothetical protein